MWIQSLHKVIDSFIKSKSKTLSEFTLPHKLSKLDPRLFNSGGTHHWDAFCARTKPQCLKFQMYMNKQGGRKQDWIGKAKATPI